MHASGQFTIEEIEEVTDVSKSVLYRALWALWAGLTLSVSSSSGF